MKRDNIFVLLLCFAIISEFETQDRQEKEIKECQRQIEAIQGYLEAKFPPSDQERARSLGNVMDFGRQLQESLRTISDRDRDWLAFRLYDFTNRVGFINRIPDRESHMGAG